MPRSALALYEDLKYGLDYVLDPKNYRVFGTSFIYNRHGGLQGAADFVLYHAGKYGKEAEFKYLMVLHDLLKEIAINGLLDEEGFSSLLQVVRTFRDTSFNSNTVMANAESKANQKIVDFRYFIQDFVVELSNIAAESAAIKASQDKEREALEEKVLASSALDSGSDAYADEKAVSKPLKPSSEVETAKPILSSEIHPSVKRIKKKVNRFLRQIAKEQANDTARATVLAAKNSTRYQAKRALAAALNTAGSLVGKEGMQFHNKLGVDLVVPKAQINFASTIYSDKAMAQLENVVFRLKASTQAKPRPEAEILEDLAEGSVTEPRPEAEILEDLAEGSVTEENPHASKYVKLTAEQLKDSEWQTAVLAYDNLKKGYRDLKKRALQIARSGAEDAGVGDGSVAGSPENLVGPAFIPSALYRVMVMVASSILNGVLYVGDGLEVARQKILSRDSRILADVLSDINNLLYGGQTENLFADSERSESEISAVLKQKIENIFLDRIHSKSMAQRLARSLAAPDDMYSDLTKLRQYYEALFQIVDAKNQQIRKEQAVSESKLAKAFAAITAIFYGALQVYSSTKALKVLFIAAAAGTAGVLLTTPFGWALLGVLGVLALQRFYRVFANPKDGRAPGLSIWGMIKYALCMNTLPLDAMTPSSPKDRIMTNLLLFGAMVGCALVPGLQLIAILISIRFALYFAIVTGQMIYSLISNQISRIFAESLISKYFKDVARQVKVLWRQDHKAASIAFALITGLKILATAASFGLLFAGLLMTFHGSVVGNLSGFVEIFGSIINHPLMLAIPRALDYIFWGLAGLAVVGESVFYIKNLYNLVFETLFSKLPVYVYNTMTDFFGLQSLRAAAGHSEGQDEGSAMSTGQKISFGLLCALAYNPASLLLLPLVVRPAVELARWLKAKVDEIRNGTDDAHVRRFESRKSALALGGLTVANGGNGQGLLGIPAQESNLVAGVPQEVNDASGKVWGASSGAGHLNADMKLTAGPAPICVLYKAQVSADGKTAGSAEKDINSVPAIERLKSVATARVGG